MDALLSVARRLSSSAGGLGSPPTRFRPVKPAAIEMQEDLSPSTPPKPRILFVEDEATLRNLLAEELSDAYIVDTAEDGNAALRAVLQALPDLIVTDIVMPDMDGIELLKTLRSTRRTQTVPVLLISGRAIDEQRIEGFRQGADAYLAKPYSQRELRACIGSMLQSARRREEATRRATLEQAERKALSDRAALLESITDAFYALDLEFRFTYLNQRTLEHFGATRERLLGSVLWDVVPTMRGTVFQQEYERALREQRSVIFETVSPLTNGWLEVRAYPTAKGLAAYFRDITDRKQAEEQLRDADRRKGVFLAVLAHEVRNPLVPLRNGLELLKARLSGDPAVSQTVAMMDRQMTHLARLVDDLLDLSQVTRGKLELRRKKVLVTEILGTAVESARSVLEANRHRLSIDLRAKNLMVDGDPHRLVQVFSNLLLNSAKYTDAGGLITLTLERENSEALVAVQDNGIGIPQGSLEEIFDMFRRMPTQEGRPTEGLGVGLSLVRTLVELHGGSVRAFSEGTGKGSRFTVRLPIADDHPDASEH